MLLRAFEALREHIPVELTVVGADRDEVAPLLLDDRGVTVLGRVDDAEKQRVLESADVLCAPSLGGESFGMVLTEAFAAGTPVVASDIAGYRDVVRDGVDGVLVPRGDATALAEALRDLWLAPERRAAMGAAAAEHAERFAWPHVAARGRSAPTRTRSRRPRRRRRAARRRARSARAPADLKPRVRPQRLPSLEPPPPAGARAPGARVRPPRRAAGVRGCSRSPARCSRSAASACTRSSLALLDSSPAWVLVGLGIMCVSMAVRAVSWHAILKAAIPQRPRATARRDAGHVHRRADVGDAAGPPRRALARADRRAPHRAPAREPAGRARDDRLADAVQHLRARCCSGS